MNFHITNWRRPWHPPDEAALAELIAIGCSWIEAAKILARTPKAIECRARVLRARSPHKPPVAMPTRCIPKPDLPAFYALGWSVVEFSTDTVCVEWRHSSSPAYQETEVMPHTIVAQPDPGANARRDNAMPPSYEVGAL